MRSLISSRAAKALARKGIEVIGRQAIEDEFGSYTSGLAVYQIAQNEQARFVSAVELDRLIKEA